MLHILSSCHFLAFNYGPVIVYDYENYANYGIICNFMTIVILSSHGNHATMATVELHVIMSVVIPSSHIYDYI